MNFMNAINKYRRSRWCYFQRLKPIAYLYRGRIYLVHNSYIPFTCEIGEGKICAYKGIGGIIHANSKIGKNSVIGFNVTIGGGGGRSNRKLPEFESLRRNVPVIGDRVIISTGKDTAKMNDHENRKQIKKSLETGLVRIEKLYSSMPIFVQNFLCNIKGVQINHTRYNAGFDKMLRDFCDRGEWSNEERCSFRDERIRSLVRHCYETVPYYRKQFDKIGIKPADIKGLKDLSILPIIDKQTINENREQFISSKIGNYKKNHGHTSGSTGAGFKFVTTEESIHAQWATFWRLYIKSGIRWMERQGTFSGQLIVPASQKNPPYWRYVNSQNRVYFSAYHQQEGNLQKYYDEIWKSKITWLSGYPSLISLLADYILRNGLDNPGVLFVSTGAENLYGSQEAQIKKAFKGAKFLQVYAQAESVAFFTQEADGRIWVDEDAAAVEFVPDASGGFDIVGTNLYNYAMPFLRYSTADKAQYTIEKDGRRRITSIDGRKEDYVVLPTGEKLGRLDYAFKDAVNISESQVYQKKDYSIVIRVVLKSDDGKQDVMKAQKWLREATQAKVPISVEFVETIERTNTHKLRYVISEVKDK